MTPSLHALFCDDIREEVTHKLALIGVYGVELYVRQLPTVMPKLCVVAFVVLPDESPIKPFRLLVLKDDETLIDTPIDGDQLQKLDDQAQRQPMRDSKRFPPISCRNMRFILVMEPLVIDREFDLRLVGYYGDTELRCNVLRIRLANEAGEMPPEQPVIQH